MRDSWRGKIRKDEPEGDGNIPVRPDWLTDELAILEWEFCIAKLSGMNVLSSIDATALAMYCDAVSDFRKLQDLVAKTKPVFKNNRGEIRPNPLISQKNKAWERVLKASALFGMSPSGRAGLAHVSNAGSKKDNGKDRFFRTG